MRLASLAILAVGLLGAGGARAASFDCGKAAGRVERTICDDVDLSYLDLQLQGAFAGALDRSVHPDALRQGQLAWLKSREACADKACLRALYRKRIAALTAVSETPPVCSGETTTQVDACARAYADRDERELARYLAAARKRLQDEAADPSGGHAASDALAELDRSQAAWVAYRKAECGAVYSWWREGTIRGAMAEGCWQAVTKARTATIWSNWLNFMDSTPPLLPEPKTR